MHPQITAQLQRLNDYFGEPHGRARFDSLVYFAEVTAMRHKFSSDWLSASGADYVNEAVNRCLTPGKDGGPQRVLPDGIKIGTALGHIIRSIITNQFQARKSLSRGEVQSLPYDEESDRGASHSVENFSESFWDSATCRLNTEPGHQLDVRKRLDEFMAYAKSDRIVHGMLTLRLEEDLYEPAEEVARRLGIQVSDVYAARKRLARLVQNYIQKGSSNDN